MIIQYYSSSLYYGCPNGKKFRNFLFMFPVNLLEVFNRELLYLSPTIHCVSAPKKLNMPRKLFVAPEFFIFASKLFILAPKFFILAPEFSILAP